MFPLKAWQLECASTQQLRRQSTGMLSSMLRCWCLIVNTSMLHGSKTPKWPLVLGRTLPPFHPLGPCAFEPRFVRGASSHLLPFSSFLFERRLSDERQRARNHQNGQLAAAASVTRMSSTGGHTPSRQMQSRDSKAEKNLREDTTHAVQHREQRYHAVMQDDHEQEDRPQPYQPAGDHLDGREHRHTVHGCQ